MENLACPLLALPLSSHCHGQADPAGCSVALCAYATKIQESIHLIRLGARAGHVSQLTQLDKTTAKRLYQQLCGKPSPPGQMPFTDTWYREDDRRMLHATLVWRLHQRLSRMGRGPARTLIDLFEAYSQLAHKPMLDITRVAFVPHLLAMDTWHERVCKFCETNYLSPVDSNSIACPGCRLYHRHRCPYCRAPLAAQSSGRKRSTCSQCGKSMKPGIQQ